MMRRYLLHRASHEEIAESLGISPQEVAEGLERVMQRCSASPSRFTQCCFLHRLSRKT